MKVQIQFDGACKGNPGPMAIGVVITGEDGATLAEVSERLPGTGTNNIAEWTALVRGLERAKELGAKVVSVSGDSSLVVNQLLGKFRVKQPHLRPFYEKATKLAAGFKTIAVQWIPRERNAKADALANAPLEQEAPSGGGGGGPKAAGAGGGGTGSGTSGSAAPAAKKTPKREALGSKQTSREHSILCPKCGRPCALAIQTFKDGSDHVRQDCPEHGFVGYAPNVEPFLSLAREKR